MANLDKIRTPVLFVVGWSAQNVAKRALNAIVHPKNRREAVELRIGAIAIGFAVAERAEQSVNNFITKIENAINDEK